jgi:hypothetical protein
MRTLRSLPPFIAFLFLGILPSTAQHHEASASGGHEDFRPHSTLGLAIGHAHVFKGRDASGKRKVLSLPSWAIDYNRMFSPKWGIGFHTDIIVETFEVEKHLEGGGHEEVVERTRPIAPALVGLYKPSHHWTFLFGAGMEYAKEESFFLNRAGAEYAAEIKGGWEVFGSLNYDFRWKAYDTWTIGLGVSKVLGHRNGE